MGLTFGCDKNNIVSNKELYSFNIGIGAIIDTNMRAAPERECSSPAHQAGERRPSSVNCASSPRPLTSERCDRLGPSDNLLACLQPLVMRCISPTKASIGNPYGTTKAISWPFIDAVRGCEDPALIDRRPAAKIKGLKGILRRDPQHPLSRPVRETRRIS